MVKYDQLLEVPSLERFLDHLDRPFLRLKLAANYKPVKLSTADCKTIAKRLAQNQTLIHLVIRDAETNDDGTAELAVALRSNIFLQILCLHHVNLGDPGTFALADELQRNYSLTELSLKFNHVGGKGAEALAQALKSNNVLRGLYLDENDVKNNGANALASALTVNSSLTILSLSDNNIDDEGVLNICESLKQNHNLRSLFLSRNPVVSSTASVILESVDLNTSLTSFAVPHCDEQPGLQSAVKERMLSNRERKQAAYEAAQAEGDNAKAAWNRSKLMVIGEGKAGKTATVRSLLNKTFDESWKSTIGVELSKSTTGKINAWTPDYEESHFTASLLSTLAINHFKTYSAADQKRKSSAKQLASRLQVLAEGAEEKREKARVSSSNGRVLKSRSRTMAHRSVGGREVGSGVRGREVGSGARGRRAKRVSHTEEEKEQEMFEYKEKLFVDALSNDNGIKMTIWDYGGQAVFYTLHHLFLSRFGVYLLVFDLRKLVRAKPSGKAAKGKPHAKSEAIAVENDAEALEYLSFWLNSVKLHAPGAPLLLVGTFGDEVDNSRAMRDVKSKIADLLGQRFTQVVGVRNSDTCLHVIDNKSSRGVGELRMAIEHAMNGQEYVRFKVPVKWMKSLDKMAGLTDNWVPLKTVHEIGKRYGVSSSSEVVQMLQLFHELGMLLHFTATSQLASTVILNPSWLVSAIGKVIRDRDIHSFKSTEVKMKKLREDVDRLFMFGLISEDLLQMLWGRKAAGFLLDLMRSLLLLSTWSFDQRNVLYLIPSMVTESNSALIHPKGIKSVFQFGFLPIGVYERLVCLLVEHSTTQETEKLQEPVLSKDLCMVHFDEKSAVFLQTCGHDTLQVHITHPESASKCLRMILAMLNKLNADTMNSGLDWEVELEVDGKMMSQEAVKSKKLQPWYASSNSDAYPEPRTQNVNLDAFMKSLA